MSHLAADAVSGDAFHACASASVAHSAPLTSAAASSSIGGASSAAAWEDSDFWSVPEDEVLLPRPSQPDKESTSKGSGISNSSNSKSSSSSNSSRTATDAALPADIRLLAVKALLASRLALDSPLLVHTAVTLRKVQLVPEQATISRSVEGLLGGQATSVPVLIDPADWAKLAGVKRDEEILSHLSACFEETTQAAIVIALAHRLAGFDWSLIPIGCDTSRQALGEVADFPLPVVDDPFSKYPNRAQIQGCIEQADKDFLMFIDRGTGPADAGHLDLLQLSVPSNLASLHFPAETKKKYAGQFELLIRGEIFARLQQRLDFIAACVAEASAEAWQQLGEHAQLSDEVFLEEAFLLPYALDGDMSINFKSGGATFIAPGSEEEKVFSECTVKATFRKVQRKKSAAFSSKRSAKGASQEMSVQSPSIVLLRPEGAALRDKCKTGSCLQSKLACSEWTCSRAVILAFVNTSDQQVISIQGRVPPDFIHRNSALTSGTHWQVLELENLVTARRMFTAARVYAEWPPVAWIDRQLRYTSAPASGHDKPPFEVARPALQDQVFLDDVAKVESQLAMKDEFSWLNLNQIRAVARFRVLSLRGPSFHLVQALQALANRLCSPRSCHCWPKTISRHPSRTFFRLLRLLFRDPRLRRARLGECPKQQSRDSAADEVS